jgi:hypothetical protein
MTAGCLRTAAACDDLEEALAWAARELGDHYIIAPLQDERP